MAEEKTERRPISQPPDWWMAFEAAAEEAEMHLSTWIGEACREKLERTKGQKRAAAKLSDRKQRGRPKKSTARKLPPRRMRGERESK
jgi:hypothetical protein